MTFGEKLRHVRMDILRLTQKELALSIGVTQASVNAVETGKHADASFKFFSSLVKVHKINPMYFIEEKGEPEILDRRRERALLHKIARYERLIEALNKVKES